MDLFTLVGKVVIDSKGASQELDNVTGKAEKSGSNIAGAFKKVAGVVGTAFALDKIKDFGGECIEAGSDVQEMQNKFDVVFDGMTKDVEEWASKYADSIGRNKNVIKEYLADNQNMFVGMGMTRKEGAKLSENMVELALDLASFNNLNEDDAVNAMSKALMGETESAKSLGAVLNENTRKQAMENLGYKGKFEALTEAQKMEVNYQAILNQSKDAVGDCARSLDSYKGRQIQLQSATENLKETIGTALLPVMTSITTVAVDVVQAVSGMVTSFLESTTIFTEIQNIFNTVFTSIKDIVTSSMGESGNAMSMVQTIFAEVTTGMQVLWQQVGVPLMQLMTNGISMFISFFRANWPSIQKLFKTAMDIIKTSWSSIGKPVFDIFISIAKSLQNTFKSVMPTITKLFSSVVSTISTQWNTNLKPVFEAIKNVLNNVVKPAFEYVFNKVVGPVVKTAFDNISKLWNNSLKPVFEGICKFISGVFAGNWKKAFQGLADIVEGIFKGVGEAVKAPIRGIASVWNSTVGKLSFTVPDWVPGIGGEGFSVPKIPAFAKGGIVSADMIARVGEAGPEAITPIDKLMDYITVAVANGNKTSGNEEMLSMLTSMYKVMLQILNGKTSITLNNREIARVVKEVC